MDRNLLSETDPLVEHIYHVDNNCTVGWTNFQMRLNPAGMALIREIDPTAKFREMYAHFTFVRKVISELRLHGESFGDLAGFRRVWDYVNEVAKREANDGFRVGSTLGGFAFYGFPYDVDCSNDSPLVGWFLVLGERNG